MRTRVLIATGVLGLAGFLVLALAFEREPLASLDAEVTTWVFSDMPRWIADLARPFSWLGGWIGLTVLGVIAVVVLVLERQLVDLVFFLIAYLGSQALVAVLKEIVGRPRPDIGSAVPLPESLAFPSGHAAAGVASLGALAVLVSERVSSDRARRRFWIAVVAVAIAIGLSRIALNVHYVTDVLAGWCLGLAWLSACLLARERFARRRRSASP